MTGNPLEQSTLADLGLRTNAKREDHVRLTFATSSEILTEAVTRMGRVS